jgi:integrase
VGPGPLSALSLSRSGAAASVVEPSAETHLLDVPRAATGPSTGEAFGLSVDDIDEGAQVIHVVRQLKLMRGQFVFAPPEHARVRDVPLSDTVKAALQTHLTRYPPLTMTFPWREPKGEPITVRVLTWTRERGALNRNSFNHHVWKPALRHFYASVLLDGGESIKALSEYLGHADPGFTLRTYTHLMPSSAERTRRAVDAVLTSGHDEGPASPSVDRDTGPSPRSDGLITA